MALPERFGRALVQLWARDGIVADDREGLARMVANAFASGDDGVRAASQMLARSGVAAQWNAILRRDRASALAARIRPLLDGTLLDVLAGDGSVCRALSDLGVAGLSATERTGDYVESVLPSHVTFKPFPRTLDLTEFDASTGLLSAVLHHEPDPVALLDALARTNIQRWIVVENCVTPEFSRPFHEFADRFFNTCLNQFGVHCVEQHRTLDEWTTLLSAYGTVSVVERDFTAPGIPFPYSLLLIGRGTSVRSRTNS
jgi:hypothetical protein